jgi:hypothetical protein
MKTVRSISEDSQGNVTGATMTDGTVIDLPADKRFHRSQLASQSRALAEAYGVELPDNPAIPPAE